MLEGCRRGTPWSVLAHRWGSGSPWRAVGPGMWQELFGLPALSSHPEIAPRGRPAQQQLPRARPHLFPPRHSAGIRGARAAAGQTGMLRGGAGTRAGGHMSPASGTLSDKHHGRQGQHPAASHSIPASDPRPPPTHFPGGAERLSPPGTLAPGWAPGWICGSRRHPSPPSCPLTICAGLTWLQALTQVPAGHGAPLRGQRGQ